MVCISTHTCTLKYTYVCRIKYIREKGQETKQKKEMHGRSTIKFDLAGWR